MKKLALRYVHLVDTVNEKARFLGVLYVIMTFVMAYEVVARFVFNAPTKWAWDVNIQLLCFTVIMSGGYTLLHKGHVRMDLFYSRWSARKRAWVDLSTSFLPIVFCSLLLMESFDLARESIALREVDEGLLHAPLYPLRVAVVFGIFLFLAQVLAEVLRSLLIISGHSPPRLAPSPRSSLGQNGRTPSRHRRRSSLRRDAIPRGRGPNGPASMAHCKSGRRVNFLSRHRG